LKRISGSFSRCDCTTVDAVFALRPDAIVLSPGPGRPESAGILLELIREGLARQMPMLGVCLGHQAIGEALGGDVIHAQKVMHGPMISPSSVSAVTIKSAGSVVRSTASEW